MRGQGRPVLGVLVGLLSLAAQARAGEPDRAAALAAPREPTPLEEDAQLHDVRFVGDRAGWAVGERGVIWHSGDGGATWQLQSSGVNCELYSVCFLTDRVGWVAGGGTAPFTHVPYGVLLFTRDGGATWARLEGGDEETRAGSNPPRTPLVKGGEKGAQPLLGKGGGTDERSPLAKGRNPEGRSSQRNRGNDGGLPRLHGVKFFSLEQGYVVGQACEAHPTGILFTEDGGRTWRDAPGPAAVGWRAADFTSFDEGAVAGAQGRIGQVVDQRVVTPRLASLGTRGLYDLVLHSGGKGCLVGDGGLNLWTENSGLVWQAAATPLPEGIRDVFDFRCVSRRGDKVWIAGQPGSAIWHTPDAGRTWKRQATGQPLPLSSLHFSSDVTGWAAGALGTILRTDNGGQTWDVIRGAGRRLAIMTLHTHSGQVSLNLVSQLSGEGGYRSLIELLPRADLGPDGHNSTDLDVRLAEAVSVAGGSAATTGWQFPLAVPGLDRDSEKLVADWTRRTEGRLADVLLGHLVRQVRMWRPSVVVLDQPASDDAVTRLVHDATLKAVDQAADSTRFLGQQELAGLEPWHVAKVFVRLPAGSSGQVNIDPHLYLPRVGASVHMAAAAAYGRLLPQATSNPLRESYKLVQQAGVDHSGRGSAEDFFAGLNVAPGSPARRMLAPIDEDGLEKRQALAKKQRNFSAYIDRNLRDPRHAGQLIGQLDDIVRDMPDAQAALQMAELSASYLATGQWELAELALMELVERYPAEPVTQLAAEYLLQSWGSAEAIWRRLKKSATEQQNLKSSPGDIEQKLEQVAARLQEQEVMLEESGVPSDLPEAGGTGGVKNAGLEGESKVERRFTDEKFFFWRNRALQLARRLETRAPALFASPSVQFPLAAIYRYRGAHARSDELYRKYVFGDVSAGWPQAAAGELWLTNPAQLPKKPFVVCELTRRRPVLDGVFSDECWQKADELPLLGSADESPDPKTRALAMLCYDAEYLYFAATFPRAAGIRTDGPLAQGRAHDADLADFDRVNLLLDVDRDYVTHYNLAVDQRGCVADRCWRDLSWNPRWFVAVDADKLHWRVEAAIPFSELGPRSPVRNTVWSVGIVRTMPAVGVQSWTHPAASAPRPETFGLVRFD